MRQAAFSLLVCTLLLPLSAAADERILSFFSDIEVHTNASMTVTETLRVRSEQGRIRRGIFRDFPTRYRDRHGSRISVAFDVVDVTRDGTRERYALEDLSNGVRVRIGRKDVLLPSGEHTYVITYRTDRQLGYFEDYDELYWNVTGNGWDFPIDQAGARVRLPSSVPPDSLETAGYTGPAGSKEAAHTVRAGTGSSVEFAATRPLGPNEGLTVAVSWPKGHVHEPTPKERWGWYLRDNRSAVAALAGFIVVLGYYLVVWLMVGKDPTRGTIIPRFRPPEKLSPAAARYLWKRGCDAQCFSVALIHLAAQGWIRLRQTDDTFTLIRAENPKGKPFPEEKKLYSELLGHRESRRMHKTHHKTIGKAMDALEEDLNKKHLRKHFLLNRRNWYPGLGLFLGTWILVILLSREPAAAGFLTLWLSFWTIGVVALVVAAFAAWKAAVKGPNHVGGLLGALLMTAFAAPFVGGEVFGLFMLSRMAGGPAALLAVASLVVIGVFYNLLEAPTFAGRRLLDELEGFRLYLSVAERDRLSSMRSPEKTPELFEAYLPYAVALDVEQAWAEQFTEVLEKAATGDPKGYHPPWYDNPTGRPLNARALAGALGGALTSSVSSSSAAPGSSSGSGGGGSSGGGGGGGGGGGW